jgi:hypothetical protein
LKKLVLIFFYIDGALTAAPRQQMVSYKRFFVRGQEQELSVASTVLGRRGGGDKSDRHILCS